jgi:hypothetical protein
LFHALCVNSSPHHRRRYLRSEKRKLMSEKAVTTTNRFPFDFRAVWCTFHRWRVHQFLWIRWRSGCDFLCPETGKANQTT